MAIKRNVTMELDDAAYEDLAPGLPPALREALEAATAAPEPPEPPPAVGADLIAHRLRNYI